MAPATIKDPLPAATCPPTIAKVAMEAAMHLLPGMVVHLLVDTRVIHLQNLEVRMYDQFTNISTNISSGFFGRPSQPQQPVYAQQQAAPPQRSGPGIGTAVLAGRSCALLRNTGESDIRIRWCRSGGRSPPDGRY